MKNNEKTRDRLLEELQEFRHRIAELEALNADLQKTEKLLRDYRDNIQTLFDQAGDFMFLIDFLGNLLKVNAEGLKRLGYDENELVGQTLLKLYSTEKQDDVQAIFESWIKGNKNVCTVPFLTKQGTLIPAETRITMTRWLNRDVFLCISRDISEFKRIEQMLRNSEERYRTIFERAPIGIELAAQNGKPLYVNQALQDMLGYSEEGLRNMRFMKYTHPDDQQSSLDLVHALLDGKSDHLDTERRYVRKDGTVIWGQTTVSAVRKADGNLQYFVTMIKDITEQKHAEAALRESEVRLRDLTARMAKVTEEERKGLARELHDRVGQNLTALNINLNIIKNRLSGISIGDLETKLADAMNLVEETAVRIRDVMAELRPEVLDDYGLAAALRWYGERFSRRTGLEVKITAEQPARRFAPDTETTLFRIAQEAMVNVAKHACADRISICLESNGAPVKLTIADNGAGFDPAVAERPDDRHGWGLISMRERAHSIGGHLRVESSPGKSTEVIVEVER